MSAGRQRYQMLSPAARIVYWKERFEDIARAPGSTAAREAELLRLWRKLHELEQEDAEVPAALLEAYFAAREVAARRPRPAEAAATHPRETRAGGGDEPATTDEVDALIAVFLSTTAPATAGDADDELATGSLSEVSRRYWLAVTGQDASPPED